MIFEDLFWHVLKRIFCLTSHFVHEESSHLATFTPWCQMLRLFELFLVLVDATDAELREALHAFIVEH